MRLLTLILILTLNNLASQELKNIDTTKSSISYSGSHFLHKWSAENNNLSGLIKTDNEIESVKPAETIDEKLVKSRSEKLKKIISETENKKVAKTSEKKSAVS